MNTQPWTGNLSVENQGLPIRPNHPYWLMHHPETCWEFVQHDNKWMFLPSFRRLFEMAGCNGVRMIPRGGCDSQVARVQMMDDGFEVLDMELGYQARYKTTSGGYFYIDIWSAPKVIGKRVIWKFDQSAFNDWRYSLLEDGVLNPPDTDILDLFVEKQEKRVQRNALRTHIPAVKKTYDEDLDTLEIMRQYIQSGEPVVIKKKRVKKSV